MIITTLNLRFFICAAISFGLIFLPQFDIISDAQAQNQSILFTVRKTLGDGTNGRVWLQWRQTIPNNPIDRIEVALRRKTGGDETFVNLRYGDGQTFENGRQVFLRDDRTQTVSWNVNGEQPNGRDLVLNAYKGEVYVDSVTVYVAQAPGVVQADPQQPKPRPRPGYLASGGSAAGADEDNKDNDDDDGDVGAKNQDDPTAIRNCRRLRRVRDPKVEIYDSRPTGGLFTDKYKIEGEIYGACIEEAGYFEGGRLKNEIEFPLSDRYNRSRFKFTVRTGKRGQLRVATFDGKQTIIDIDALVLRQKQQQNQDQGNTLQIPLPF